MTCPHEHFESTVNVNRLVDIGRFTAEIKIRCVDCGAPMRFLGLPLGLDLNGAAVSVDGTEGRFAIHPKGEQVPGLADQPAGFRVLGS